MNTLSSPCILVCVIDTKTGFCFGCGRTGNEISDWSKLAENKRLEIMADLEQRLTTVVRKPRRETRRAKMKRLADNCAPKEQCS